MVDATVGGDRLVKVPLSLWTNTPHMLGVFATKPYPWMGRPRGTGFPVLSFKRE